MCREFNVLESIPKVGKSILISGYIDKSAMIGLGGNVSGLVALATNQRPVSDGIKTEDGLVRGFPGIRFSISRKEKRCEKVGNEFVDQGKMT